MAQVDTDFWFAVPYLSDAHDHSQTLGYGKICITTFGQPANVTISQPGITNTSDPFYLAPQHLMIAANNHVDISVGGGSINRAKANGLSPYGLHIEADVPVTVYFAQTNNNSEIYTLKGRNALGTSFLVGMQKQHANAAGFNATSSIDILATEDNTLVTINTPVFTRNSPASLQQSVTLQKGQIYTIQARDATVPNHLGGTIITSNKPICVNSNDDSLASNGQDLVGEQLVSADLAGSEYIAIKHTAGQSEKLFLYTFPNQPITYTIGNGAPQTLAGGASTAITLSSNATYIAADAPFVCFQLTGDGGELGGTILPRLDCTGSTEVVFRKRFPTQKVNLMVRTAYTSSFTFNGVPQNISFQTVPNSNGWSYCEVSPAFANNILRIANSAGIFHASILDYGGGTCSYGYFSNYNTISLFASSDKTLYQQGETIHLSINDAPLFTNITWTFPDGTTHTGASVTNLAENASDAGTYTVTAESSDGCPVQLEYNTVMVSIDIPDDPTPDDTLCTNGRVLFFEDFGGNSPSDPQVSTTPVPSIASSYKQVLSNNYGAMVPGGYLVAKRGYHNGPGNWSQWLLTGDHTHPGDTTRGYFLEVDGRSNGALLYEVRIPNVTPGAEISFSAYVANVEYWKTNNGLQYVRPEIGFRMKDAQGRTLSTASSGPIPIDTTKTTSQAEAIWHHVGMQFIVPAGVTSIVLQIFDNAKGSGAGNDFAIDDISVIQCCSDPNIIEEYTTICDTLLPQEWHNKLITEEGIYVDSVGCDIYIVHVSVVHCEPDSTPRLNMTLLTGSLTLCDGEDSFELEYQVKEGTPNLCTLQIGGLSTELTVPPSPEPVPYKAVLPVTLPEDMAALLSPLVGPIMLDVTFSDTASFLYTADSVPYPLVTPSSRVVTYVLYDPEKVFAQKWDNVLAIFSPEYSGYNLTLTTDYQWYRNGQPIPGATGSYYRLGEYASFDLGDYYQAEVTRVADGIRQLTCPYYPHQPSYVAPQEEKASKMLINQHIYIILSGKRYTLEGLLVETIDE